MTTKNEKDYSEMTVEELRQECVRLLRLIDDIDDLREILTYLREIVKGE